MVVDHFLGADLRRLGKRDLHVGPGCFHQPLRIVLHVARRSFHHEAHAVHQADVHVHLAAERDLRRLLGDEFGLRGGDRLSSGTLWQLILRPHALRLIRHIREHQQIHKPLDKGGFSRPHRADHADVDFSSGSFLNISV